MKIDPGLASRLMELEGRFRAAPLGPSPLIFARGEGVYLWDIRGQRFMDFRSGDGAVNQGYTHTRIAACLIEQSLTLPLAPGGCTHDRLATYLEKLCARTGTEAALPLTTEAEAVDAAIHAARHYGCSAKGLAWSETEVLVFSGSPNGACTGAPGFTRAPYGDLEAALESLGPRTCAVLVEPLQGDQGLRIPPRGFLKGLRSACSQRGILLLLDERASGLGRTGAWFAFQHEGIRPDGILLGGSLAGGFYPASALAGSRALLEGAPSPTPGPPFGGCPPACAAAMAALAVLAEENLVDRSAELGAYFLARLRTLDAPRVREVRGLGLWAALDLEGPADVLAGALAREGLLCSTAGEGTLMLAPPLVITREQLDWALERLERGLRT
jgi:ornithine--oxo-acid transaminase